MVVGVAADVFESAVIIGIFTGTIYAMMALGIVASFRINRVVNLGIPGLAVFGATIYFQMSNVWGAPDHDRLLPREQRSQGGAR